MSARVKDLLVAVLKLTPAERSDFARSIQELVDDDDKDINLMSDDEFEVELNRRAEEAARDPSVLIPWETVKQRMLNDEYE